MAEEMKNQETMDDFAKEIDASFESFRDADMDIWEKLEKMKEEAQREFEEQQKASEKMPMTYTIRL